MFEYAHRNYPQLGSIVAVNLPCRASLEWELAMAPVEQHLGVGIAVKSGLVVCAGEFSDIFTSFMMFMFISSMLFLNSGCIWPCGPHYAWLRLCVHRVRKHRGAS